MTRLLVGLLMGGVALCAAPAAMAATKRPDLVITKLAVAPATVKQGGRLLVSATIRNAGAGRAKRSRLDVTFTRPGPPGTYELPRVASRRVRALRGGARHAVRLRIVIPLASQAGIYGVRVCADSGRSVRERNERNNCRSVKRGVRVRDVLAPSAPRLTSPTEYARTQRQTLRVVAERTSTVRIYFGECSGTRVAEIGLTSGSSGVSVTLPRNATTQIRATATDVSGNTSRCSAALSMTHDDVPPPAPTITGVTPPSPSREPNPLLRGTAEAEATVHVTRSRCGTGTTVSAASGPSAKFAGAGISVPVSENTTTRVYVRAVDRAGNNGACTDLRYVHDSEPPSVPTFTASIPSPANADDVRISVFTTPGSKLEIFSTAQCAGTPLAIESPTTTSRTTLTRPLAQNATTTFSARAADSLGNVSICSEPFAFVESSAWEAESNDSIFAARAAATDHGVVIAGSVDYLGRIWPGSSDVDTYLLDVDVLQAVTSNAYDTTGADTCAGDVDMKLELLDSTGATLGSDDNTGLQTCTGFAFALDPGEYFLRVTDAPFGSTMPETYDYRLATDFAAAAIPTTSDPASPAVDGSPEIRGDATPGSNVALFGTDDCSGAPLASGSAAAFTSPGLTIAVPPGQQVIVRATAAVGAQTGPCSGDSLTYVNSSPG